MHPGSFLGETTEERPWVDPGQTKDIVSVLGMPWYLQSQWPWKGSSGQAFLQPNFNVIP